MLSLAQTQTLTPASQRLPAPGLASHHPSFVTPHFPNQSLAKHNRKPSQIIENNHQRLRSIASFCRVFRACWGGRPTLARHPALTRASTPSSSLAAHCSPLSLANRYHELLETNLSHRKQTATLHPNRNKMQRSRGSHDNMQMRLLLLDTPSGTACTGFDQGCKDRARKPFLAVIQ
jgi:hypothetical protein